MCAVPTAFSDHVVMASRMGICRVWGWCVDGLQGRRGIPDEFQVSERSMLIGEIGDFMENLIHRE